MFLDILSLIARLRAPPTPRMRGERDQVPRAKTAELLLDAVGAAQFSAWRCQPLALTASCSRQGRFAVAQAVQKGDSAPETPGIWRMSG